MGAPVTCALELKRVVLISANRVRTTGIAQTPCSTSALRRSSAAIPLAPYRSSSARLASTRHTWQQIIRPSCGHSNALLSCDDAPVFCALLILQDFARRCLSRDRRVSPVAHLRRGRQEAPSNSTPRSGRHVAAVG